MIKFHIRNWPPPSACHGSGRWGQKGVKRGSYLYHTLWEIEKSWKIIKKVKIIKIIKNTKNSKNQKIIKTQKSTKCKNQKTEKVKNQKLKSEKSDIFKNTQKWPKCQINGQNRHFVFSEPPGWAIFGFWRLWGVPRPL